MCWILFATIVSKMRNYFETSVKFTEEYIPIPNEINLHFYHRVQSRHYHRTEVMKIWGVHLKEPSTQG